MKRREFLTLFGGAAAAAVLPRAARPQQSEPMRRIGVLRNFDRGDPEAQSLDAAFRQRLAELGWIEGRNLRIDYRWAAGDLDLHRKYAAELLALAPDVVLASGMAARVLQKLTRTVPVVFVQVNDPVATSMVTNAARPGGNMTGFVNVEYGFTAKWVELLKQISPRVTRAAVLADLSPNIRVGTDQLGVLEAVAPSLGMELTRVDVREPAELERALTEFASLPNGGIIVTGSTLTTLRRDLIIALAAKLRIPAAYPNRLYATAGGLISYGPPFGDQNRRAADYVDRILKGANPGDLPVQQPARYETVLNLKTARVLGLDVPRVVIARSDVIE
jgi:putative ABC transport system substrate-binding protein